MTLGHPHFLHRSQRRGSGKLMVSVIVAASRLVPSVDRDVEREKLVTDPYER